MPPPGRRRRPRGRRSLTAGAERFVGAHHVLRPGLRAGAHLAVGRRRPHPAHPARPAGRPRRGGPGHRPGDRRLRGRASPTTSSWPRCSPRERRSSSARPCTPRCGSTRRCRRTWPRCAAGASTSSNPGSAGWPAATSAPVAWPSPRSSSAAVEQVAHRAGPGRRARPRHRRRHPGAHRRRPGHHQPLVGQAGLRRRRRGRSPRRQGDAGQRPSTCPAPAGRRGRRRGDRGRDGRGRARAGRPGRRGRHGRRGGRLPPGRVAAGKIKKDAGPPEIVLEPTVGHPGRARASASARARCWSASRPRPTTSRATPQRKLRRKHLDLIVANDVSAPSVGFEHDTNAVTILGVGGVVQNVPLADKRVVAGAVLDAVVAGPLEPRSRQTPPRTTHRSTREPLDLHLGIGHRGTPRQDRRPGLRRGPRRHPGRRPGRPRGLRDAADHRAVRRRRRGHDPRVRRHPLHRPRDHQVHRLRPGELRLRRQHLRRHRRHRRAEPRHRPGRGHLRGGADRARAARTCSTPRAPATRG